MNEETTCNCFPEVLILLESSYDGEDLLKKIGGRNIPRLQEIRSQFNTEHMEFQRSRLIAKSNNENSLDYYQEEGTKYSKMERVLKEAEDIVYESN